MPKVISSTRQDWSVGQKNISGTVFHIVLKSTAGYSELKIDSLCISNEIVKEFKYSVLGKSNTSTDYIKGDSILISFNKDNNIKYMKYNNIEYNCVFISLNNKKKTVKLNSFKTLNPIIND